MLRLMKIQDFVRGGSEELLPSVVYLMLVMIVELRNQGVTLTNPSIKNFRVDMDGQNLVLCEHETTKNRSCIVHVLQNALSVFTEELGMSQAQTHRVPVNDIILVFWKRRGLIS